MNYDTRRGNKWVNSCMHGPKINHKYVQPPIHDSKIAYYYIQGSAERWALGCVNSCPMARGSQEVGFTQPRAHLFVDPCTYGQEEEAQITETDDDDGDIPFFRVLNILAAILERFRFPE